MTRRSTSLLFAALLLALPACAARRDAVLASPEAPLGRVIIYRNGVAYFERQTEVDGTLSLRVPTDRVDDFLKSLTVTDVQTGSSLPVSYPTAPTAVGEWIDMAIALPPGRRTVSIAYVTESPAWKPSYRVTLDGSDGGGRLQSLAVVDNISGEAWRDVEVGVGSTSALSFRYDLHSVRMVERETLGSGTHLAQAPPMGGSPYAVGGANERVLASVSSTELDEAPAVVISGRDFTQVVESSATASRDAGRGSRRGRRAESQGVEPSTGVGRTVTMEEFRNMPVANSYDPLSALQAQLADNTQRVRIEGYGLPGEDDPQQEGLRRANTLRDQLMERGISSDRIEVVAGEHPVASPDEAVQVIAIEHDSRFTEAVLDGGDPDQPRGTAHFVADGPMSLQPGHSAMVTLFDEPTEATRVYLYDPLSARGSKRFAFNAVRMVNPSDNTLDSGPITVYAKGRFLGEGLTEPVPPHEAALVPYALDRTLVVEPAVESHEQVQRLVTVERGIATTRTRRTRETTLTIDNRGQAAARMYVRHHVGSGWTLQDPPDDLEHMGRDILVPVTIEAGARRVLTLMETMPVTTALDLRSERGLEQIAVYLNSEAVAEPLRTRLAAIVGAYRRLADVEQTLSTRHEQMDVLQQRVGELAMQLKGLRKVERAQELSGHLAKRMRGLGDRLDGLIVEVTELEADELEARIGLQNLVAELTVEAAEGSGAAATANAVP